MGMAIVTVRCANPNLKVKSKLIKFLDKVVQLLDSYSQLTHVLKPVVLFFVVLNDNEQRPEQSTFP